MSKLQTVVELPEFIKRAKALMSDDDRMALINMLAAMPDAGISLGGGLRKVRFSREGGGKRGGYRTLYVFGGRQMPLFLLTVFAKNEKDNLTRSEQAALVDLSKTLIAKYGEPS
ncbi:type II toxin-antitoxin system RelE/ParE family toxin [Gluconobacter cerinus]|uniref:type II toxin-antitoxin system RelE/ParE family toxin n=1 Tax=Gluconobacter cerinus TaxID=38307 RepID=UPI001B8D5932|nr:type II toxin-antitoxin system RelE/ParE family toxin [Gluconobacter cerinus]MBS1023148.1 type II toxin-antitoxin system RelE/ParE family toxin [Gluconobacter cerinus]MBS1025497.1 type II toxin-antitoxin system RelE/ParE family toxin [Gluconobacter cerinus]